MPALGALAVCLFSGCSALRPSLSGEKRDAIYARAEQIVAQATVLKPREPGGVANRPWALAPLLLQETNGRNPTVVPLAVYYGGGTVYINQRGHEQMTYLWPVSPDRMSQGKRKSQWQGIRITLNSQGEPVIWEVLADSSGAQVVFVAQSVEAGARQAYGPAGAGRRFAVEASEKSAPDTLVARVIEDGPVVMGPIVYLTEGTGDVRTLICRCMPAQAREVGASGYYDLRPLAECPEPYPQFPPAAAIAKRLRLGGRI